MKKLLFLLCILYILACTGNKDKKQNDQEPAIIEQGGLVSYKFDVKGLQDSIVSDSIWKMIFQIQGIEKLVISQKENAVTFTVNPQQINNDILRSEIEKRGGKLKN